MNDESVVDAYVDLLLNMVSANGLNTSACLKMLVQNLSLRKEPFGIMSPILSKLFVLTNPCIFYFVKVDASTWTCLLLFRSAFIELFDWFSS